MKNVTKILVQGCRKKICQGWAKKISVAALGATFLLAPLAPMPAKADGAPMTQLQYLQWMAQLSGVSFSSGAAASTYVNWAVSAGLNPASSGGWNPNAILTKAVLSETLAQRFNLNQGKFSGDYARLLTRQGVDLSNVGDQVTKDHLVGVVDQFGFQALTVSFKTSNKGNNGDDNNGQVSGPKDGGDDDDRDKDKNDHQKFTMCHKGHTIIVGGTKAHLKHLAQGDTDGKCHVTKHGHDRDDDDH